LRMPHMRPITGSCGLSSGSRRKTLPASRGARSVDMPSAVRAPNSARPVGVEGSATGCSLTERRPGPLPLRATGPGLGDRPGPRAANPPIRSLTSILYCLQSALHISAGSLSAGCWTERPSVPGRGAGSSVPRCQSTGNAVIGRADGDRGVVSSPTSLSAKPSSPPRRTAGGCSAQVPGQLPRRPSVRRRPRRPPYA
jgi:hypothetical protein